MIEPSTKERIAALMADGRERTSQDVANRLRIPKNEAARNLRDLHQLHLITKSSFGRSKMAIWQKAF